MLNTNLNVLCLYLAGDCGAAWQWRPDHPHIHTLAGLWVVQKYLSRLKNMKGEQQRYLLPRIPKRLWLQLTSKGPSVTSNYLILCLKWLGVEEVLYQD